MGIKGPRFQGEKPRLRGDLAMYLTLGTSILSPTIGVYIHYLKNNSVSLIFLEGYSIIEPNCIS